MATYPRKLQSLFQTMYYVHHCGRKRTPMHIMNAESVHALGRGGKIVTSILNHKGLALSYTELRRYQQDLASFTAQHNKDRIALPSHFDPGQFTSGAIDNWDHKGARVSEHDTVTVLFQDKPVSSPCKPNISDTQATDGQASYLPQGPYLRDLYELRELPVGFDCSYKSCLVGVPYLRDLPQGIHVDRTLASVDLFSSDSDLYHRQRSSPLRPSLSVDIRITSATARLGREGALYPFIKEVQKKELGRGLGCKILYVISTPLHPSTRSEEDKDVGVVCRNLDTPAPFYLDVGHIPLEVVVKATDGQASYLPQGPYLRDLYELRELPVGFDCSYKSCLVGVPYLRDLPQGIHVDRTLASVDLFSSDSDLYHRQRSSPLRPSLSVDIRITSATARLGRAWSFVPTNNLCLSFVCLVHCVASLTLSEP
ncbi:hypothetical protein GWK47_021289 [Chionoecetes opilio]|uniref:Uncharacterized protein n=1 Tax=Chionoecetes opilio TaxID=41210 RepID=A0A8J5CKK2_CHIOP|nr:hypothetical protein GWK47_021289 [Chionoecetes opilio]